MEYKRFGGKIVVRLEKGDELCASLLALAETEEIRLASVSGIGASNDVTLGVFNTQTKEYFKKRYSAWDYELASVTGNLTRQEGKAYLHLHAVIGSPANEKVHAGHLNAAVISATGEIAVDIIEGDVDRRFDPEIGLNLFRF